MKCIYKIMMLYSLVIANVRAEVDAQNVNIEYQPQQINIQNNMFVNNKKRGDCTHCFGRDLAECMSLLNKQEFRKSFQKLNHESRKQLLLAMSIHDYEAMLQRFTDVEWIEMLKEVSAKEDGYLPKTKSEQMQMVAESYFLFYEEVCKSYIPFLGGLLNWLSRRDITKEQLGLLKEQYKKCGASEEAKVFFLNQVFQEKKECLLNAAVR